MHILNPIRDKGERTVDQYRVPNTRVYNIIISTLMLIQRDRLPAVHRLSFVGTVGPLSPVDHSACKESNHMFSPLQLKII